MQLRMSTSSSVGLLRVWTDHFHIHSSVTYMLLEPLVPSALEEFGVPNHPTIPSLTEVSKKRAREPRTQFDEALYAKRLKISAVSISNDVLTKQSVIPSYFVQGLTRHQKEAVSYVPISILASLTGLTAINAEIGFGSHACLFSKGHEKSRCSMLPPESASISFAPPRVRQLGI